MNPYTLYLTSFIILTSCMARGVGSESEFPQKEAWQIRRAMMERYLRDRIEQKKQALSACKAAKTITQHIPSQTPTLSAVQQLIEKDTE